MTMQFVLKKPGWVIHDRAGPAVRLCGEDELGEPVTVCVIGELPRLVIRVPPGVRLPADMEVLDIVMSSLNRSLAARYHFERTKGTAGLGEKWCTSDSVDDGQTPKLIRNWKVDTVRSDSAEQMHAIVALFAHPEHLGWARKRLQRPLGEAYKDQPPRPWLSSEVVARLWGVEEDEVLADAEAGRWAFATVGETRYEHEVMRRVGIKVGDFVAVSNPKYDGMVRYTSEPGEAVVPLVSLSKVETKKRKKGAPPVAPAVAPPLPADATTWKAKRGLSEVVVWTAGAKGWAVGTTDALQKLEQSGGWRQARVRVDGVNKKGVYAATLPEDYRRVFAKW
jgi:hypothetical protein